MKDFEGRDVSALSASGSQYMYAQQNSQNEEREEETTLDPSSIGIAFHESHNVSPQYTCGAVEVGNKASDFGLTPTDTQTCATPAPTTPRIVAETWVKPGSKKPDTVVSCDFESDSSLYKDSKRGRCSDTRRSCGLFTCSTFFSCIICIVIVAPLCLAIIRSQLQPQEVNYFIVLPLFF